jgi:YD repeat-containing protein
MVNWKNYQLGLDTGEVQASYLVFGYQSQQPLVLTYSSAAANPHPTFLTHDTLDPTRPAPPTVSATLTLNGVAAPTVYYNTSLLNPGDIMEIPLQANATALPTGRYSYQIAVTANYGPPVTTTYSGQVNVINERSDPLGAGWFVQGVQRLWPVAGGVIDELAGGTSLWFASSQGGSFTSPAGDFSTLVQNADGTYTRTMKDGTQTKFLPSGLQLSTTDLNGNSWVFNTSPQGNLLSINDPSNLATSFGYDNNGRLVTVTDPASRVVANTSHDANGNLTGIADTAGVAWTFAYDSQGDLTQETSPWGVPTIFSYSTTAQVYQTVRPDGGNDLLTPLQAQGLYVAAPGQPGSASNPAQPVLAVQAAASYTDPMTNTWQTRLDWLGQGQPVQSLSPLGNMQVSYVDPNGLAWLSADPLGRRTRSFFDTRGNATEVVKPDDATDLYSYNGNSRLTSHTDPDGNTTTFTEDIRGNTTGITNALNQTLTATFTSSGRPASTSDPLGHGDTFLYNAQQLLTNQTDAQGKSYSFQFDNKGNPTITVNENGQQTRYTYDLAGRLTDKSLPGQGDYLYAYDTAGNVGSVTLPSGDKTSYIFNSSNYLAAVKDPAGNQTNFLYDKNGHLVRINKPSGVTTVALQPGRFAGTLP